MRPESRSTRRLDVSYWTIGGQMSKSSAVVEAFELTDKYGHDAFRYFLLREMNFGLDASFSEEAFVGRLNADLANDLGNLVSRATTMIVNFGGGRVPKPGPETDEDAVVRSALAKTALDVDEAMEDFAFQRALAAIWEFLGVVNRYVDATAPWGSRIGGHGRLDTCSRSPARYRHPHRPFHRGCGKIRAEIGGAPPGSDLAWGRLAPGTAVHKVSGLFRESADKSSLSLGKNRVRVVDWRVQDPHGRLRQGRARVASAGRRRLPKSKKLLSSRSRSGTRRAPSWPIAGVTRPLVGRKVSSPTSARDLDGVESMAWCWPQARGALSPSSRSTRTCPGSQVRGAGTFSRRRSGSRPGPVHAHRAHRAAARPP